ncbi:MAG: cation-translocating P-type ATPase, partial [Bdellovibrionia bacterium]
AIGKSVSLSVNEPTRLQRETKQLVRIFGAIGLFLCAIIAIIATKRFDDWTQGVLLGIATAMSLLPEEFPVIITIFLAMGAWRISKKNVLTRKIPALENLGTITTLCVDKTGTLTQNKMTVKSLATEDETWSPQQTPGKEFQQLLHSAVFSSPTDSNDPMEIALHELQETQKIPSPGALARVYPLTDNLFALTCVWKIEQGQMSVHAKGSPEAILDLCHLDRATRSILLRRAQELAGQGLRVLGVANAPWSQEPLPESQHDFDFGFLGFVTFEDPIRPEALESIEQCGRAGIRVVMITGDHPATAKSIAAQLKLENADHVLTGDQLRELNDLELAYEIKRINVFARTVPDQKLRLINALKANGEIVAMTGDGVNDVPSLKWANVGIAMGNRGSDVARETADLVLTDDNFSSIVSAIQLGRRIFENIRRAMLYVLAVHVPIAGMALIPILFGLPVFLLPAHVLLLELIIDPASSLVFEAEPTGADMMARPPRAASERIIQLRSGSGAFARGFLVWLAVFGTFLYFWNQTSDEATSRTLGFVALVVGNLSLVFSYRTQRTGLKAHSFMWILIGAASSGMLLLLFVPFLRALFRFTALDLGQSIIAILIGLLPILVIQSTNLVRVKFNEAYKNAGLI